MEPGLTLIPSLYQTNDNFLLYFSSEIFHQKEMLPNFKIFRQVDRHGSNYSFAEDGKIIRRTCDTTYLEKKLCAANA